MNEFMTLNKLVKDDQVGVISPSSGLPGLYPEVFELGLKRMREEFSLNPVEYPTTRQMGSSLEDRARDIMAAFAEKKNKAIFASIGGNDQIKLIKHLDEQVFINNPKPFFGYSDNTHLQLFLWNLGIPSYYGGGVMNQFGMNGKMDDYTVKYLKLALFETGEFDLDPSDTFNEEGLDWGDPNNLERFRKYEKNEGWYWIGEEMAEGILWGGCLESLEFQLREGTNIPDNNILKNTILFIETSEGIPSIEFVKSIMELLGERGLLERFSGLLVGRPKSWEFDKPLPMSERETYRKAQRDIMVETFVKYNKKAPIVLNMNFGHTDPQIVLPVGRKVKIDPLHRKIVAQY